MSYPANKISPPDDFNKWQYGDFLNNYLNSYWNGFFGLSINMWFEWLYETNTFNVYWYGDKCISYLLTWNYELQGKLITSDAALFQGIILMNNSASTFHHWNLIISFKSTRRDIIILFAG